MTDKVIIDYTKCKYNTFDGGGSQRTICSLDSKYCDCLRDKECYYKQLQRKTQECEKLKEENEKQKERIKQLEDFIKSDGEIDHINHEYTYKLKKVLQEVKSIAKGVKSYLGVPAPRDVRFEMDRILDIITKTKEQEYEVKENDK